MPCPGSGRRSHAGCLNYGTGVSEGALRASVAAKPEAFSPRHQSAMASRPGAPVVGIEGQRSADRTTPKQPMASSSGREIAQESARLKKPSDVVAVERDRLAVEAHRLSRRGRRAGHCEDSRKGGRCRHRPERKPVLMRHRRVEACRQAKRHAQIVVQIGPIYRAAPRAGEDRTRVRLVEPGPRDGPATPAATDCTETIGVAAEQRRRSG